MTDKVMIYKSLEDYAKGVPVVEILGVSKIAQSYGNGFCFLVGDGEEHVLPANTIFVLVSEDE